ncbi:FimV/HubP family polar landmark protein [Caldimonas brevitalea]|uniref:Membrane protein n=1 Tax=Caldimonas brevitalea TaxID=413882 RepID=A0A0G3BFU4_9BURK|nr:FimV/HubP family polar landmark protein [Caldimonas brevitalea]AKJ28279.1 membrane protein [Caldimonas brevitalea]
MGEGLRAEIDITSMTPEEEAQFRARIAAPDAYRAAGVDYNAVLPQTQVTLLRRTDGRPYLRITSDRVVQEPFVDVILELSWASGRLVREYTLLLDPPTTRQASNTTTAPAMSSNGEGAASAAASRPRSNGAASTDSAAPATPARTARAPEERRPAPARAESARAADAPRTAGSGSEEDQYTVRRGDTLSSIAGRVQRTGVSLDQMLVALYRTNPDAFIGQNLNRLKAGAVLSVPSTEQAESVSPSEARQVIQAQSADFAAYRQRLAGAVPSAGTSEPSRQASGQVSAAVEDRRQAAAPSPDRLTLSKGALGTKGAGSEEQIAKEREKKDVDTRVAELSRNLQDLKKIAPKGAGTGASAPTAPAPTVPGVQVPTAPLATPPAPASAPAAAATPASPAPASAPAIAAAPTPTPTPAPATPASEPVPADAGAVIASGDETASAAEAEAASAPAPAPVRPAEPAPAPAEPSFMEALRDNPLLPWVAGGVALLLAGLGVYRLKSKGKKDSGETSFLESRLQPDSFFGASGGQRIDTKDASGAPSSLSYSLSQLDAIGDVDPVAEADVYLAYGRDLQAEEILKEAMRATPERLAIRTKLLEVYAKRRDTKGFELLATQLHGLTHGEGEDWARAQELGRQVDPDNTLYQPGGAPANARPPAQAVEPLGATTMPHSVMPAARFEEPPAAPERSIDLDLDLPMSGSPAAPRPMDSTAPFQPVAEARTSSFGTQDLGAPAPSAGGRDLDMSFDLPDLETPAERSAAAPSSRSMDFDLDSLSLDLGGAASQPGKLDMTPSQPGKFDELPDFELGDVSDAGDPLARKLELAEEFRQIGDREGARELLQEVVSRSSGALKAKAQTMLAELV